LEKNNNKIILTNRQVQIINGCLLGDGHLKKCNTDKCNSQFVYTSNIENHVKFVYNEFSEYLKVIRKREVYDKRTNKNYIRYSISYIEILS